ncbi:MAG: hypothetical protein SAJ12_20855, partial [Jaaginema sp. PMC 1079.18]|nr:hypothetical protein [Jaaginema sp. PMC 1079.18]
MKKIAPRIAGQLTLLTLLCVPATLSLTACNPTAQNQNTTTTSTGDPNTLKLLYWQAPTILNPHLSTGFKDSEA